MNKNITIAAAGLIVILAVAGFFIMGKKEVPVQNEQVVNTGNPVPSVPSTPTTQTTEQTGAQGSNTQPAPTQPSQPAPAKPAASGFTLASIASHNSRTSCYSAIDGGVYDLTSYIDRHPGGPEEILAVCGKDGSSLFGEQHGGDRKIVDMLKGFKVGSLSQ